MRSWRPLLAALIATALPVLGQTGADTTRPTVTSFELDTPTATPTSARMIITFNEPVTGVDASDFQINGTLTSSATLTSVAPGPTAATYYVAFAYTGTSGSLQMAIKSSGTGITDAAGNAFVGQGTAATTAYPVNNTPPPEVVLPTVTSLVAPASVSSSPTNLTLIFSEAVAGVSADDFFVSSGATVGVITGTGTTWTVPVSFTGTTPVSVTVIGGATSNIRDAATHWFAGGSTGATVLFSPTGGSVTAPAITSLLTASIVAGAPFSYTITGSNSPTSLTATSLPTGLTYASPNVTGSVATPGVYNIALGASNTAGSDSKTLVLTVTAPTTVVAPIVTSPLTASIVAGASFSYTVTGSNSPTSLTATGLPAGLTYASPNVTGSIATPGVYNIALGASNTAGSDNKTLVLTVTAPTTVVVPVVTSPLTTTGIAGMPLSYTITGSNSPTSFTASGLPAGLTFTSPNVTGTVATPGVYNLTVRATNSAGTDSKTLVLTVTAPTSTVVAPVVTSPLTATVIAGMPFSYTITGLNSPTSFTATGLPTGLTFTAPNVTGGVATPGVYNLTIRATNTAGTDTKTLVLTVIAPDTGGKGPVTVIKRGDGLIPGQPFTLPAMTASGQPIMWVLVSGNATLNGNVLTPKNKGAVVVRAFTAGNTDATRIPVAEYEIETDEDNKKPGKSAHRDRLSNLSSRLQISNTDSNRAAIAGFVVTGNSPKQVLVRAIGPGLGALGLSNVAPGATLQLHDQSGAVIAQNDGWKGDAAIAAAGERVGAFKLAVGSSDSALLITLPPGLYTAIVGAKGNGLALLEVYDAASSTEASTEQLINISTRGYVDSGDGNLIAGFVITGAAPKRVLVRGIGAALTNFGVANALADPVLELYTAGGTTLVARNDNWGTAQVTNTTIATPHAEMLATMKATGAFPLADGSKDAAILVTLMPGNYSAVVTGANRTTGAGLVEIYEVPNP